MKFVLSFAVFTLLACTLHAQSFHFGVKAGADIYKLNGRSFDGKFQPGFSGGVYGQLNIKSWLAIQPELLFSQTRGTTSEDFNNIYHGASFQDVTLNYITLPVLAAYKPIPELSILLGPQFGYLISQPSGLYPIGNDPNKNLFNKSNIAIVFGGQLNLHKIMLGARYDIGLNDLNNVNGSDPWKNHGFQFYVGYRIL